MVLNRTLAILVCAVAFMTTATPGYAGDAWRVVQSVGTVKVGGAGMMPAAVTSDQTLPGGAWVETSPSSRALLMRGADTIAVAPSSRVQLPSEKVNGNTQVLQSLGSVLYQIGKEQKPHFQVDTPYLAAVVKGTTFTVTVANGAASVAVTEGLVEVANPDHTSVEYVRPGFTAAAGDHQKTVTVDVTVAPAGPAKPDEQNSTTHTIVIPQAIGEVTIDVNEASEGLINQPSLPPTAGQTTALNTLASDGDDDDNDSDSDSDNTNTNTGGGNSDGNNGNDSGNGAVTAAALDLTPPDLGPGNSDSGNSDSGNSGNSGNSDNGGNGGAPAPDLTPPELGAGNGNSGNSGNAGGLGLGTGRGRAP